MSRSPAPHGFFVEALRLLVVVFGAAVGLQVAHSLSSQPDQPVLGLFTAPALGVIIGAGLGYSLGGVIARRAVTVLDRTDRTLERITPDELVSGALGALVGALLGTLIAWPVFLVAPALVAVSLFVFVVLVVAALGFRVGQHRRDAVLGIAGSAGVAVPAPHANTRLIDSSVAIDGRIVDVVKAGFGLGRVLVCQPVLDELQQLADASDPRRRDKGRRGLAVLDELRRLPGVTVQVIGDEAPTVADVDAKLVRIATSRAAALLTMDTGLAKVAAVSGVQVQNLHALSLALRPPVAIGDTTTLTLLRAGKETGQAVGYLDDGTMVVVEHAAEQIGSDVAVVVTSVLTTANGRMAFARRDGAS